MVLKYYNKLLFGEEKMPEERLQKTRSVYDYKFENKITREQILIKAKEYLKHEDYYVKILAQIAIYHYGDS